MVLANRRKILRPHLKLRDSHRISPPVDFSFVAPSGVSLEIKLLSACRVDTNVLKE